MSGDQATEGVEKVLIIGGACAGYTAAIYTGRASLDPLVIIGDLDGGQLTQTSEVENYPGFPEGVLGTDLMQKFRAQAEKFGARLKAGLVTEADFSRRPFTVRTADGETYRALTVIIATGASARWLGLPSEEKLRGKGVSACATCDGFFFRGKEVAVIGGGDAALEEGMFLTKFATKVTVIHRRDEFRASRIMQERARKNPKVSLLLSMVPEEVLGTDRVEGLKLKNVKTGETSTLPCQGVFVAIGHEPNTRPFQGQVELDQKGYVVCRQLTQTSVPGVFAAGDVKDSRYQQAISAAGSGCQAAIDAEKFLEENASG